MCTFIVEYLRMKCIGGCQEGLVSASEEALLLPCYILFAHQCSILCMRKR